jgi:formylglycine-generating enzyme required for sulfatase activity
MSMNKHLGRVAAIFFCLLLVSFMSSARAWAQNEWVGQKAGEKRVLKLGDIEIALRWCPPGAFLMGSPATESKREKNEEQAHVALSQGFWMMETEVTQELYQAVTGTNPSGFKGQGSLPVEQVSWDDAMAFTRRLNEKIRITTGARFALPTEAQWEYACRAGTTTATAFGDSLSSAQANFDGSFPYGTAVRGPYVQKTTPVRSYQPNAWGLYDMHGNVWEWCADWYDKKLAGGTDPTGPTVADSRVYRGGSWNYCGPDCRSAYRYKFTPGARNDCLGFRLVLAQ